MNNLTKQEAIKQEQERIEEGVVARAISLENEKRDLLYQQMKLLAEKSEQCKENYELCELSHAIVEIYKADRVNL
jgi:ethanolamine utilization protein EutQ (cupin superfamily)